MAEDRRLSAVLEAKESISSSLSDIADEADSTAASMEWLDESAESAGDSLDAIERGAEGVANALSGITDDAGMAAASLEATEQAADAAGDEFQETTREAVGLSAALSALSVPALGMATVGTDVEDPDSPDTPAMPDLSTLSFDVDAETGAAAAGARSIGDEADESRGRVNRLSGALSSLPSPSLGSITQSVGTDVEDPDAPDTPDVGGVSIPTALSSPLGGVMGGLGGTATASADIDTDAAEASLSSIRSSLQSLPDLNIPTDVSGPRELRDELGRGRESARRMAAALESLDVDTWGVASASQLADQLEKGDQQARATSRALDGLSGSARGFMDDALAATTGTEALEEHIEDTGSSAIITAGELNILDQAADGAGSQAIQSAGSFSILQERIDETGDEALTSAGKMGALGGSMGAASGASTGLGASLFGLHGSLSSLAVVLPAIVGLGGSLAGVLGGLTVAAGGLAGVVGAGLVASFISLGETAAARSEEAETAAEGLEIVFANVRESMGEALQPLAESDVFSGLAIGVLEGAVNLVGDLATFAAELAPAIMPVVDTIAGAFWDETPAFFTTLEDVTLQVLPYLEDMMVWLASAIPQAMSWMGDMTESLAGDLGDLSLSVLDLLVGLAEFGGTLIDWVAEPLAWTVAVVGSALDAFNALPEYLQQGALGALAVGAAITTVIPAVWGLATALWATGIPQFTIAVSLLAGAVIAAVEYFDLWDDIAGALGGTLDVLSGIWDGLISAVEWGINAYLNFHNAIARLIPGMLTTEQLGAALGATMEWLGGAFQWAATAAGEAWSGTVDWLSGLFQDLIDWAETTANQLVAVANTALSTYNRIPGLDDLELLERVEFGDVGGAISQAGEGPVDLSGLQTGQGGEGQQPPPAQSQGGDVYQDNSVNVDVGSVTSPREESSAAQIESQVERQLERNPNRRRQQRQRKRNYPNA